MYIDVLRRKPHNCNCFSFQLRWHPSCSPPIDCALSLECPFSPWENVTLAQPCVLFPIRALPPRAPALIRPDSPAPLLSSPVPSGHASHRPGYGSNNERLPPDESIGVHASPSTIHSNVEVETPSSALEIPTLCDPYLLPA